MKKGMNAFEKKCLRRTAGNRGKKINHSHVHYVKLAVRVTRIRRKSDQLCLQKDLPLARYRKFQNFDTTDS